MDVKLFRSAEGKSNRDRLEEKQMIAVAWACTRNG
jgi:hypothetical protein